MKLSQQKTGLDKTKDEKTRFKLITNVDMFFLPSVALTRHLYSSSLPALAILFLCTADLSDADERLTKNN